MTSGMLRRMIRGLLVCAAISAVIPEPSAIAAEPDKEPATWKVGAASVDITPDELMWMAGYAARKKPADGIAQRLYGKAVAIEDQQGHRLVMVTLDLIGVLRSLRDAVEDQVQEKYGLPPGSLLLNASHTHCGPEYRERPGREEEARRYHAALEGKLVAVIGQALKRLEPARLSFGEARAGFAANRRGEIGVRRGPILGAVTDHAVPVLKAESVEGELRAVVFGYACHNTTLSSVATINGEPRYEFNGDYAGYAQEYLQQAHPGAVALFMNGCGADQNPHPRRDMVPGVSPLEMAQHHGRTLSLAVEAALTIPARPVGGPLKSTFHDVNVIRTGTEAGPFPYPVQVVQFGSDLTLVALASEVVVDYSLRLKRELGATGEDEPETATGKPPALWIAGYSNGYFGYIPSVRILEEGGYEAGPWDPSIEERIVSTVHELNRQLKTRE